jgi:hypothetical protein
MPPTTDDDAGNEQIEKVGVLGELRHRGQDRGRQQMMEGQIRRDEGGKDRRRPDVADDRDALAQFGAGKAAHREQHDRHQNIGRHRAGGGEAADDADEDDKNRQRNDADLVVDERPPALRPKTLDDARLSLRHATNFLRHRIPSPFLNFVR